MDAARVALEVQKGLSIICATCERYWQGKEQGTSCLDPGVCGSPFAGLTFSHYKGPITDFSRWCFVCGSSADFGVRVGRTSRVFGICQEHVGFFKEIEPQRTGRHTPRRANGVRFVEIVRGSEYIEVPTFVSALPKTLGQVIAETEAGLTKGH